MPWYQTLQIVVVTVVALSTLPAAIYTSYSARLRYADKVKRLLDLTDKLASDAVGRKQIESALNDATTDLAYFIQYPRTLRDRAPLAFAAVALLSSVSTLIWNHRYGASMYSLPLIVIGYAGTYFLYVSNRNLMHNDRLTRLLFLYLHAPVDLIRPQASLISLQPEIRLGDVLQCAADIRDYSTDRQISTIEAVNEGMPIARSRVKILSSAIRRGRLEIHRLTGVYYIHRMQRPIRRLIFEVAVWRQRLRVKCIIRSEPDRGREMSVNLERMVTEFRPLFKVKVESPRSIRRRLRKKSKTL